MAKFQAGACRKGLPVPGTHLVREEAICLVQHLWVLWCSCFKQEPWFPVVWVEMEKQGGQQPLLLPFCRPQGMGEWECSLGNGVCKSFWGVWCCSFLQLNEITFFSGSWDLCSSARRKIVPGPTHHPCFLYALSVAVSILACFREDVSM